MIEPPGNIARYTPNAYVSRRRRFLAGRSYEEWVQFFQRREFEIRWVIPWWKIEAMVGVNDTPHCRIPSLNALTFYFPTRVIRQYGHEQRIPLITDRSRPREVPLREDIIQRFEAYWADRPLWTVEYFSKIPTLSKEYRRWLDDPFYLQTTEKKSKTEAPKFEEGRPRPKTGVVIREPVVAKTKPALLKGKGKKKVIEDVKVNKRKGFEKGGKSDSKVEVQVKEGALIVRSYLLEIGEIPEEKDGKKEEERPVKRPPKERFL